jgi:hypothetical protein
MNTFLQYWDRMIKANPGLGNDENRMTLSVSSLRCTLRKAYDAGSRDSAAVSEHLDQIGSPDFRGLFDEFFKK